MKRKKIVLSFSIKLCMILLSLVLSACATAIPSSVQDQQTQVGEPDNSRSELGWYTIRFSIPWKKGVEPEWYIGTLIAGEIISPLLEQSRQKIVCWRIHRRAVHDKTGHALSFIFYSSQDDAAMIYQLFENDKLLAKLHHQHLFVKITYDPLYNNKQTEFADTSDTIWPEKIRSTWPFFMMGASQMWLEQISAFKKETLNEPEMKQRYIKIQSKITDLWQQQGEHALMHHLNALYAYQPVLVRF